VLLVWHCADFASAWNVKFATPVSPKDTIKAVPIQVNESCRIEQRVAR
jgi:hypothetical protein